MGWVRIAGLEVIVGLLAGYYALRSHKATTGAPEQAGTATHLLLVETDSFDSSAATITVYQRGSGSDTWVQYAGPLPATVGRNGLGWGHTFRDLAGPGEPIKVEGDKRAPAGVFSLGRPFGLSPDGLAHYMQLEKDMHLCVDDVGSEHYSRIVPAVAVKPETSVERMWEIELYKRGIVVDYPTDRAAKSGSCIFLHVWKNPETATVGCVATSEDTVARLQKWVSEAPNGAWIAIVPRAARGRLGQNLPE